MYAALNENFKKDNCWGFSIKLQKFQEAPGPNCSPEQQ